MKIDDTSANTDRNLSRTRIVVLVAFATNALANVLLIGFFARLGGLDLVGTWAFLSAILMSVLIVDFGATNALTYRIAKTGVQSGLPYLRLLLYCSRRLLVLLFFLSVSALIVGWYSVASVMLTIAAAIIQLIANWYCAIRMGKHEQYWFNIQTILRVVAQAFVSTLLIIAFPTYPELALSTAMLTGNIAAFGLSWTLVRTDLRQHTVTARWADLRHLLSNFGFENVAQRAFQPMLQLALAQLLGSAALGVFTIALRIPVVVNQSISEALRILLPGIVDTLRKGNELGVVEMLRRALITQIVLIIPAMVFFAVHARIILTVWIDDEVKVDEIAYALQMLCASMMFVAIATPFYWSLLATGNANIVARSVAVSFTMIVVLGCLAITMGGGVLFFVAIFAVGQVGDALFIVAASERKFGFPRKCISQMQVSRLLLFLVTGLIVNFGLNIVVTSRFPPVNVVTAITIINIVFIGIPTLSALRRKTFIKSIA